MAERFPKPRFRYPDQPRIRLTADEQLKWVVKRAEKKGVPLKYRLVGTLYDSEKRYVGDRRPGIIVEIPVEEALAYRALVERVAELAQHHGSGAVASVLADRYGLADFAPEKGED